MPNSPTVCLACLYNNSDEQFLQRFLEMHKYNWVTTGVGLKTDAVEKKSPVTSVIDGKLRTSQHDYFGTGFERQPKDGGFNELRARNNLLRLAESTNCDWILVADPDELFQPETFSEIQLAHRLRKNVIWFECYHFCSPNEYVWWESSLRQIHGSRRKLHDPHPRAFRTSSRLRYVQNNNNKFRKRLRNHTMHCHIQAHSPREAHIAYGIYHIHTRHMFNPKRPSPVKLASMTKKTAPVTLPLSYVEAFKLQ